MPTDRSNVTNKQQSDLEEAEFDGGSPVFVEQRTRVVAKGVQTASYRTANAGSTIRNNAGVCMPHDDVPGRFVETSQGKP